MRRAVAVMVSVVGIFPSAAAGATTTFSFTGAEQQFAVPAGVSSVHAVVAGASGGNSSGTSGSTGVGGRGAMYTADVAVTPGSVLFVMVGGAGNSNPGNGLGGFNGGGNGAGGEGSSVGGGGGGGGASDLRTTAGGLASRILVAGGGGGGSTFGGSGAGRAGGAGGGSSGDAGQSGAGGTPCGGGGGTQSDGGSGTGSGGSGGALGVGGAGVGGGGGGHFGGAASSCTNGAGGGGSGFFPSVGVSGVVFAVAPAGNGSVTISYLPPPEVLTTTPASPANTNAPKVSGTAVAGATVDVYASTDCTGQPVASGTAAQFASPGITVGVSDDTTSIFRATQTTADGTSGCSPTSVMYVEDSTAPVVTIDSPPDGAVTGPQPIFTFHTSESGATFQCSIDTGVPAFGACSGSGVHQPGAVAVGRHTFRLRATDAAGNQGSVATITFTAAEATPTATPTATTPPTPTTPPTATPTPTTTTTTPTATARAPETRITAKPKRNVTTRKRSVRVRFRFSASNRVATFRCKLDSGRFRACDPGQQYRVRAGSHRFAVKAVLNGVEDPTPATFSFKVERKRRLA